MPKKGGISTAKYKRFDKTLFCACAACSVLSVLFLFSMALPQFKEQFTSRMYLVQALASSLGILSMLAITFFNYKKLMKLWFIFVPASLALVALTYTSYGVESGGNKAWLDLPHLPVFQPAEILKIVFILTFAYHLSALGKSMNKIGAFLGLCIHGAIPFLMVLAQPDTGTALVFLFIFIVMMIFAGLSWKYILSGAVIIPLAAALAWFKVMQPHQKARILILFDLNSDPEGVGYQQLASLKAIRSGGIFGKGLFEKSYLYVAKMNNDFIFSFTAQALGIAGCAVILLMYAFIAFKILRIGLTCGDKFGKCICTGVFAMLVFHVVVNVGMNFGVMPVVGITLPLMSAGGTSVLTTYIAIGLVMSVGAHRGGHSRKRRTKRNLRGV